MRDVSFEETKLQRGEQNVSYYTQRHGLRKPIQKTDIISCDMYGALLSCCKSHFISLAWKFSVQCPDGKGISAVNEKELDTFLKFEVPSLYRNFSGELNVPKEYEHINQDDLFSILDLIECIYYYCRSYIKKDYHDFFMHHHLFFNNSPNERNVFRTEINEIFQKTGLQFILTNSGAVERVVDNSILTTEIENNVEQIKELGLKELLQDAITAYKTPHPASRKESVEKIWDALERLKTYYTTMNKKASTIKIVADMSNGQDVFETLFNNEFTTLTKIGNEFRIRHHETDKIEIADKKYYDYFFNRCLSLIALAIQYLH